MLSQWDPFNDMARIHDRFFGRNAMERDYAFRPAVDIYEDDKGIHVSAELAGVSPDDIKVEVENNVLTLSGERKLKHDENKDGYHRVERFYGSFSRSFVLNDKVDTEAIDAKFRDGVLELMLPKKAQATRKAISVQHTG